ncbi:hypothetical protein AMTR_s00101p00131830 [Amborella trichopoda]|uniref:Uncharacterized protein n=2 Tax=Amborella trichopoda TaxID=13333 RepID=W1NUW7_AMBTC|nr:hypothetical protein AMTR_s00101p00131830 [Amborella trichopoda]
MQYPKPEVVQKPVVPPPAKPKVTVKPKPENIIEVSSDTEQKKTQEKTANRRASRKKVHTLTQVLTARSKAACGLKDELEEKVDDIDAADVHDQLAVVDYIEDIYAFYKKAESLSQIRDYMGSQVEINDKMRAILTDWLIEVHLKFELMPETLYLTMHIVDRYLSMKIVKRRDLQLVGVTAMLVACKYEEIWAPEINDFVCISDKAYSREQILAMEKDILNDLEWNLTVPTPYVFLARFLKAAGSDKQMEDLVFFFAELSLMHYVMTKYSPSKMAASAVYAARCTLNRTPFWTQTLILHTGLSEAQVKDCASLMAEFHSVAIESKLKVIYRKYSNPQLSSVALLPSAAQLLLSKSPTS